MENNTEKVNPQAGIVHPRGFVCLAEGCEVTGSDPGVKRHFISAHGREAFALAYGQEAGTINRRKGYKAAQTAREALSGLKVSELRDLLRGRKLPGAGKRDELIERLISAG